MSQSYRDNGVVLQQHLHAPRPALPCGEIQLVDERESERERAACCGGACEGGKERDEGTDGERE